MWYYIKIYFKIKIIIILIIFSIFYIKFKIFIYLIRSGHVRIEDKVNEFKSDFEFGK